MVTEELMITKDYEDFASEYLGIDLEDYLDLVGYDFSDYEHEYSYMNN